MKCRPRRLPSPMEPAPNYLPCSCYGFENRCHEDALTGRMPPVYSSCRPPYKRMPKPRRPPCVSFPSSSRCAPHHWAPLTTIFVHCSPMNSTAPLSRPTVHCSTWWEPPWPSLPLCTATTSHHASMQLHRPVSGVLRLPPLWSTVDREHHRSTALQTRSQEFLIEK
jgi:hypothetical protein